MMLVVISPERDDAREPGVLRELFAAGLARYHLRKPHASETGLAAWIEQVPAAFRDRLVLHQHHELVQRLGLGGRHWRDDENADVAPEHPAFARNTQDGASFCGGQTEGARRASLTSRSCHDLATLRRTLGRFDSVFYGPVFPSISKPGYGPKDAHVGEAVGALLATRTEMERRTGVIALGGITPETASRALALGFDGVAVLGAVWQAADPLAAFVSLKQAVAEASASAPAGAER